MANFNLILKLAGDKCNLKCQYCYETQKNIKHENDIISIDMLKLFFDRAGENLFDVVLHGGEPLAVGAKNFIETVNFLSTCSAVRSISIQSNLLLFNSAIINALKNNNVSISTSIDGGKKSNSLRFVKNNILFDKTVEKIKELNRFNIRPGVVCTVTRMSLDNLNDDIDFYVRQKDSFKFLRLNPCFFDKSGVSSITPNEYASYLIGFFESYIHREVFKYLIVEPFVSIIRAANGSFVDYCDFSDNKCEKYLTLYPDGSLTTCDVFDSISHSSVVGFNFNHFTDSILPAIPVDDRLFIMCSSCRISSICHGGCVATRMKFIALDRHDEYCSYRARVIDYVTGKL